MAEWQFWVSYEKNGQFWPLHFAMFNKGKEILLEFLKLLRVCPNNMPSVESAEMFYGCFGWIIKGEAMFFLYSRMSMMWYLNGSFKILLLCWWMVMLYNIVAAQTCEKYSLHFTMKFVKIWYCSNLERLQIITNSFQFKIGFYLFNLILKYFLLFRVVMVFGIRHATYVVHVKITSFYVSHDLVT